MWIRHPERVQGSPILAALIAAIILIAGVAGTRASNGACARDEQEILAFVEKTLGARDCEQRPECLPRNPSVHDPGVA